MSYPNDPRGRQPEGWESNPTQHIPPASGAPSNVAPGYGQQPQMNPFGAASNETFGIAGTVLALLGGVLGVVAITALTWFSDRNRSGSVTFGEVRDAIDRPGFSGFSSAYFSWLAWAFLIVTVAAAVGSSFPSPAVRALRIVGVVVGVAAAGLSFLALRFADGVPYSEFIKHAREGFYLLVIAYLLAAIGAGIGPSRVSPVAVRR